MADPRDPGSGVLTEAFCAAHRGLSARWTENTVQAFVAAAETGFPALEMDLRLTRDKEVVVLHDAGLERTTGSAGRVADMRYDEVMAHPTPHGPVPRLDSLMDALEDWGGLWDLELKDPAALGPVLELLEHHHLGVRAHLTCMDPRPLRQAAQLHPEYPSGLIVLGAPDDEDLDAARQADCAWVHLDTTYLTPDAVDAAHDAGLRVGAWTVNEPARAAALADMGVECVITDTDAVLEALQGRAPDAPWF